MQTSADRNPVVRYGIVLLREERTQLLTTRIVDDRWKEELTNALASDSSHVTGRLTLHQGICHRELCWHISRASFKSSLGSILHDFADRVSDVDALRRF